MSLKANILKQLKEAEGRYVSGQALAERYSVSRAAVWKAVSALKKEGYALSGTPKAGYRLSESDVLDKEELESLLKDSSGKSGERGVKAYVFSTLPSTNAYAEKLLGEGFSHAAVIAANEQTEGRARRGGEFSSEAGGLYMSLLFFPLLPIESLSKLIAGVHEAVHEILGGERRENEIFHGGRKACGILTECVADPDGIKSCIAGIGVYPSLLPEEVKKKYPSRSKLCAAICKEVLNACKTDR